MKITGNLFSGWYEDEEERREEKRRGEERWAEVD